MKKRLVMISLVPSPAFLCEMNLSSARELHFRLQETGDEAAGTFFSQLTFGQCVGSWHGALVKGLASHQ